MIQYFLNFTKKRQYILLLGDTLILCLSIFISYLLRVYLTYPHPSIAVLLSKFSPWLSSIIVIHIFSLYLFDQYNLNRLVNMTRSSVMAILSVWFAGILISGIFFFVPKYVFGRQVLLIHILVVSLFIVLWRLLFTTFLLKKARSERLAVVGDVQTVSSFIEDLSKIPSSGFIISNICVLGDGSSPTSFVWKSLTRHESILELLKCNNFDAIVFDSTNSIFSNEEVHGLLQARFNGKAVYDLPIFYKNLTGKVPLNYIDGRWLLNRDGLQGQTGITYIKMKRVFDMILSSLLLVVFFPIFFIIAVVIKLESKGKVFFLQERLGIHRRPFTCIKFRTMIENAEGKSGPIWSIENDPRITRVGRFLRKSRLDELPQLWNILKGNMSFVGPRPIREHFAKKLEGNIHFYGLRFGIKPGLSGWAQVNYDYAGSDEGQFEKFQYELFYIQNMSLVLDLIIIFKTIKSVFAGIGK